MSAVSSLFERVYTTLPQEEQESYQSIITALRLNLEPPQQRAIHKLAFRNRKRNKGDLVDLATNLSHLATKAFPAQEGKATEELKNSSWNSSSALWIHVNYAWVSAKRLPELSILPSKQHWNWKHFPWWKTTSVWLKKSTWLPMKLTWSSTAGASWSI